MRLKFGVPCSKIKDMIKDVDLTCTSEAEAMAMACGAWFAGKTPEVYMQNSGLGHTVDIVTSLYMPYEIPLPKLLLSIRKNPYHHIFMKNITMELLKMLKWKNVEMVIQE